MTTNIFTDRQPSDLRVVNTVTGEVVFERLVEGEYPTINRLQKLFNSAGSRNDAPLRVVDRALDEQARAWGKPWYGGDGPPADWDGGDVLLRCGATQGGEGCRWGWINLAGDIIAYNPKPAAPAVPDDATEADTMRYMREIAQGLGYPSVLEALEACPPANLAPEPVAAYEFPHLLDTITALKAELAQARAQSAGIVERMIPPGTVNRSKCIEAIRTAAGEKA